MGYGRAKCYDWLEGRNTTRSKTPGYSEYTEDFILIKQRTLGNTKPCGEGDCSLPQAFMKTLIGNTKTGPCGGGRGRLQSSSGLYEGLDLGLGSPERERLHPQGDNQGKGEKHKHTQTDT